MSCLLMVVLSGLKAHCGGDSDGWASGQLLQENDHSLQEPGADRITVLIWTLTVSVNQRKVFFFLHVYLLLGEMEILFKVEWLS